MRGCLVRYAEVAIRIFEPQTMRIMVSSTFTCICIEIAEHELVGHVLVIFCVYSAELVAVSLKMYVASRRVSKRHSGGHPNWMLLISHSAACALLSIELGVLVTL